MSKKRVLIIDDDVPLTKAMRINLEQTGDYEVEIVNDSTEAIGTARDFKPDIILLDVVMPKADGGDISAALEGNPMLRGIPVLIVTALVSSDESTVESGGQTMIGKPIKFDALLEAIEAKLAE